MLSPFIRHIGRHIRLAPAESIAGRTGLGRRKPYLRVAHPRSGLLRKAMSVAVALAAPLLATSCGSPAGDDGRWRRVGGLDGDWIPFVAIQPEAAKDGAVYRDAINRLCGPGRCFQVGFFMTGDTIPPSGPRGSFFRAGGWGRYRPLAVYLGGSEIKCSRGMTVLTRASPRDLTWRRTASGSGLRLIAALRMPRNCWQARCGRTPKAGAHNDS